MDNEVFLNSIRHSYESLDSFQVSNNTLYFNDEVIYTLPLTSVNLSMLNPNLYLLKPRDIYRVIYLLELFSKKEISEYDKNFIRQYTLKYLKLETMRLENQELDENEVNCLSIPIYTSYDSNNIDKPASKIIQEVLNNHAEEIESSKVQGQRLVLTNPNFPNEYTEDDITLSDLGKAGFTTVLLIAGAIITTIVYIAYFIVGH